VWLTGNGREGNSDSTGANASWEVTPVPKTMNEEPKPVMVLLGAHRWRRQHVVRLAQHAGFDPVLLLYDHESLPEDLRLLAENNRVMRLPMNPARSAEDIAKTISTAFCKRWFVLALDDYVCQLAAELSTYAARQTMPPWAALETLHKHLLRARWNSLCEGDPKLYPVPFRLLQYRDTTFNSLLSSDDSPAFTASTSLIAKPNALAAIIHDVTRFLDVC
jgi:hypothetical protein